MAVFQTMILLGLVVAVQTIGRRAGGSGTFPDALLLLAWLQFVMIAVQIAQLVVLLVVPPLFGLVTMASLAIFMWLLVNFTMALHGFTSALKVAVGTVFAFFRAGGGVCHRFDISGPRSAGHAVMLDVDKIRADFPILSRQVNGKPLVYLDNGASAQKPRAVIDAVTRGYAEEYANVHRGLHYLSNLATDKILKASVANCSGS